MVYSLHKSGVITGTLNSFCLACDSFLKSEHEARQHTELPLHKMKICSVQYSDKFEGEHVRKFKWGYYCEFCNLLLPIASKVNLHVNENEHKQNKNINLLQQMGDDVIAFNNIVIEEKAWHGLIDEICSICNAEYDDETEHKGDGSHCLNLVLKPIQFGENNAVYRHLDESSVQCLTCNKLFAPGKMTEHFIGSEHRELYSKHRIETNGVSKKIESNETSPPNAPSPTSTPENGHINVESKIDTEVKTKKKTSPEENSKIMEAVVKYQSQGVNINLETETAFCKKCSNVIPFEFMEIEKHIKNHSSDKKLDSELLYPPNVDQNLNRLNINDKTTNKTEDTEGDAANYENQNDVTINSEDEEEVEPSSGSSEQSDKNNKKSSQPSAEPSTFAKENQITYTQGSSEAYCRICSVNLPSPLKSMQEHVAGAIHKKMSRISTPVRIPTMLKQESRFFFDSVYQIESFFLNETIINEEFCIPQNSYLLISKNNPRWRCILCEENILSQRLIIAHIKTKQHVNKMEKIPVIISEESELIREVRPGLFHCGYCNLAVGGWVEMKKHLKCEDHLEKRFVGERRMELHRPDVQRHKMMRNMEAMRMMWLLNRLC